jgi:hypothetical protein
LNDRITNEFRLEPRIVDLYRELFSHLKENEDRLQSEIEKFESDAVQNHITYAGEPLAIGFYPVILTRAQSHHIASVTEAMMNLMEKATSLFLQESVISEFFGFPPEQIGLIEIDPGYKPAIPCARFDSFFDGTEVRFTEINTDGTAGMDGAEKVAKLFLASPTISEFFSKYPVHAFDISRRVLQALLECYEQFAGSKSEAPRIAIVDWKEARTSAEFIAFEEFCRNEGYEAIVADPREFEYDGLALSHRGLKIDLIYRRVVSGEYIERLDEVAAMTQAFKDHNVCLVGSFRSDVAFNKKIFALLHKPELSRFFTEGERKLVQRHVPWSHPFEDAECDYRGKKIGMPGLARERKDGFVLKPSNLYEGRGVYLGFQKTESEWDSLIEKSLGDDYILQEFLTEPSLPIGVMGDDFGLEPRFIHFGEFVFGGKFIGYYCRAAEGPLIDRTSREHLAPCLIVEG